MTKNSNCRGQGPEVNLFPLPNMPENQHCPCQSGMLYMQCCAAVLSGEKIALTAEMLMRSRYSAYIAGDSAYLLKTWHPSTRPLVLDPATIPDWCGLKIIRTEKGQAGDKTGVVEFRATARSQQKILTLHEVSYFVKEAGHWLYVSGEIREDSLRSEKPVGKVGRNDPCPCGSGKKFKKCCA